MRINRPPDRFGLPPNYRWIHGQPPDPPPDIFLGGSHLTPMEIYGGYLSGYSNIFHSKSNRIIPDSSLKIVKSWLETHSLENQIII